MRIRRERVEEYLFFLYINGLLHTKRLCEEVRLCVRRWVRVRLRVCVGLVEGGRAGGGGRGYYHADLV